MDARAGVLLTPEGLALVEKLEQHWVATFGAIACLEEEIGHPLRRALEGAAQALERQGFSARITAAKRGHSTGGQADV